MVSSDLNKILESIKNAKSIQEVKKVKGEDGKDFFSDEEKQLFTNSLISNSQKKDEEARKVGELLARIKSALEKKVKDSKLMDDLEGEKSQGTRGSVAYRVVNANGLARRTMNYLSFLGRSDLPKNETERKAKIKEYEDLIDKKRGERSDEDSSSYPFELELKSIADELTEEKETLKRREQLQKVLGGDLSTVKLIDPSDGDEKALNLINLSNVRNYTSTLDEDTAPKYAATNAKTLIDNAYNYLDSMESTSSSKYSQWWEEAEFGVNLFNDRRWFNRNSLENNWKDINYGFLLALREIGDDKLNKLIENSGATSAQKTEAKKVVEAIMKCVSWQEAISGIKGFNTLKDRAQNKDKALNWEELFDTWQADLLKKGKEEYPNVPAFNWNKFFGFMVAVFPVDNAGKLISKDYYNEGNDNFIKPKDSTKNWSDIKLDGYSKAPSNPGTYPNTTVNTIAWYVNKGSAPSVVKSEVKDGPLSVPNEWKFPSVVQLWWNVHFKFIDQSDVNNVKWKKAGTESLIDREMGNMQCELRFCRTMRDILLELKIASEINEYDDYLLEIAGMAEKEKQKGDYDKSKLKALVGDDLSLTSLAVFTGGQKVYAEDYNKGGPKSYGKQLAKLVSNSKSRVSYLESRERGINDQINKVSEQNYVLDGEIEALKEKIRVLKELNDFDKKPLPGKKDDFNALYNKKDSQGGKWKLIQINQMLDYLKSIKTEMEGNNQGDKYKSEKFEEKQTELEGILKLIEPFEKGISFQWKPYRDDADKELPSEAIKAILKEKGEVEGKKKLEEIAGYFKDLADKIILSNSEQQAQSKINEAIADPNKFKDVPPVTTRFDKVAFKEFFGIDENDVFEKWKELDKEKVKKVLKDYGKGGTKNLSIVSHINEKGVYNKGGNDGDKRITETGEAGWNKFIKDYSAEVVIKTVLVHQNDDALKQDNPDKEKKKKIIEGMRNNSAAGYNKDDATKNTFKKEDYGDPTEGKEDSVTRDQIVTYLYDNAMGQIKIGSAWADKKEDKDDGKGGGKEGTEKTPWWKWGGYMVFWLTPILILTVVAVIFWKQISEWWNGPAEEEGIGADNKDEEEMEDK